MTHVYLISILMCCHYCFYPASYLISNVFLLACSFISCLFVVRLQGWCLNSGRSGKVCSSRGSAALPSHGLSKKRLSFALWFLYVISSYSLNFLLLLALALPLCLRLPLPLPPSSSKFHLLHRRKVSQAASDRFYSLLFHIHQPHNQHC